MAASNMGGFGGLMSALETLTELGGSTVARDYVEEAASAVVERTRDKLGHDQPGWPPLSQYTQENRVRLGFTPNDPLLMSGQMASDLSYELDADGRGATIGVPADAPSAKYAAAQEFGYAPNNIPARPFLGPTIREMRGELGDGLKGYVQNLVAGVGGTRAAAAALGVSQRSVQRYITSAGQKRLQSGPRLRGVLGRVRR